MRYKGVIFDLDGTLLNTLNDLMDSVNYALRDFNMPKRSPEEIRCFVGNGARRLITMAVSESSDSETVEKVLSAFKNHYNHNYTNKTYVYDGIPYVIDELRARGLKIGIISNKPDNAVKELSKIYFGNKIDFSMGDLDGIPKKPHPFNTYVMLNNMGLKNTDVLYIGDSDVDLRLSQNAGLDCLLVSWGFRRRDELMSLGQIRLIDSPLEILEYII